MRNELDRGVIKQHLAIHAQQTADTLKMNGINPKPVIIKHQHLAWTPLGRAWCKSLDNLFAKNSNARLGKSYLRAGAVLSLTYDRDVRTLIGGMDEHPKEAIFCFKELGERHEIEVAVNEIQQAGAQARKRLAKLALEHLDTLMPVRHDIICRCNCGEWRHICWHSFAGLYAIGTRLDEDPMMLFSIRNICSGV